MILRTIQPADNTAVARVIRTVMTEFGAVGAGYSIEDPEVDAIFEAYNNPQSAYYVVENERREVVGGGGIAPLRGGSADTCELKKMYVLPAARGHGMGRRLLETLEAAARARGFSTIYLETVARMESANRLYGRRGFELLAERMGNTGHSAAGLYYAKTIDAMNAHQSHP